MNKLDRSELDKCISHDNEPFLVITKNYSKHFQKIENSNLVEIPYVQKELISKGYIVGAIRQPTVKKAIIRLIIKLDIKKKDLIEVLRYLKN